jgi:serine/threonine-protein kinase
VKLIDFGIATSARVGPVTEDGTVLGKLTYMAPEHARGDDVDGRADQYSAAVVLVELLTGTAFNDGLSREQQWSISGIGGHRPKSFASLDPHLRTILDRALDAKREKRFPTCSMFGEAIVEWARARGHVADARDLRRLVTQMFPALPADARHVARSFADVRAPALDAVVKTPGFETIATTMMVAPTTVGLGDDPQTQLVRDRSPAAAPRASLSVGRRRSPALLGVAVLVGAAAGVVAGVTYGNTRAQDDGTHVVALPSTPALPPAPPPPPPPPSATPPTTEPVPAATTTTPTSAPVTTVSPGSFFGPVEKKKPSKNVKLDAETTRNLAFVATCVNVVPCAPGVLDMRAHVRSDADKQQLSEAAEACRKQCLLKK